MIECRALGARRKLREGPQLEKLACSKRWLEQNYFWTWIVLPTKIQELGSLGYHHEDSEGMVSLVLYGRFSALQCRRAMGFYIGRGGSQDRWKNGRPVTRNPWDTCDQILLMTFWPFHLIPSLPLLKIYTCELLIGLSCFISNAYISIYCLYLAHIKFLILPNY